ncbi:BTB/POZ domain-containing protein 3-like [Centruroides vittatus]|uniref:BTB/POZ domain-containing protein 3-like n=1 Tax=Centruroides vittatus TaxID=120091 RepID=UPI00350F1670
MQNLEMSWQSGDLNIKQRLSYLMTTRQMADVTLIVGQEKENFPTHSLLLSIYSEVFHAMFYGIMAEKRKHVDLPVDDVTAFRVFINYIYTDEVALHSVDEAIRSLHFAEKYMVTRMKKQCSSYLTNNISLNTVLEIYETAALLQQNELTTKCWNYITENASEIIKQDSIKNVKYETYLTKNISLNTVLEIYETAAQFQQNELTTKCWNYITRNASKIIKQNIFKYVKYETILKLVSQQCLALKSELDMYDAVIKWGKEKFQNQSPEDLRKKLDPLLDQIRFLSMTSAEFAESPCQDGILTKDEQVDIFREIATRKKYESNNIHDQWRKPRRKIATRKRNTRIHEDDEDI